MCARERERERLGSLLIVSAAPVMKEKTVKYEILIIWRKWGRWGGGGGRGGGGSGRDGGGTGNENKTRRMSRDLRRRKQDEGLLERRNREML